MKQLDAACRNGVPTFALPLQLLKKNASTPEILKARYRSPVKNDCSTNGS